MLKEPKEIVVISKGIPYTIIVDADIFEVLTAWTVTIAHRRKRQYVQIRCNGETHYLHRFIMDASFGTMVDHWNRNSLDNRRENLRFASNSENQLNKVDCNTTNLSTGMLNIYTIGNSFRVVYRGKDYGRFNTLQDAVSKRDFVRKTLP